MKCCSLIVNAFAILILYSCYLVLNEMYNSDYFLTFSSFFPLLSPPPHPHPFSPLPLSPNGHVGDEAVKEDSVVNLSNMKLREVEVDEEAPEADHIPGASNETSCKSDHCPKTQLTSASEDNSLSSMADDWVNLSHMSHPLVTSND